MLEDALKQQLQEYLQRISHPVDIIATLDASDSAREMKALIEDIASLSTLISVRTDGNSERTPSFIIRGKNSEMKLEFAGIPMGHEFTSLVLALLQSGGYPPKVSQALIDQVKQLDGDYQFETYISLSCQNCPDVVQALNLMSVLNPRVQHTMIDGALFEQEVASRRILSVPAVYLNGQPFSQGRMTLEDILTKLDKSIATKQAEALKTKDVFDVLVVGGGPAGASAAIYAARKGIRTGVLTERFGGQVLDTLGIENFISVKETEGPKLAAALEEHVKSYDVDIMSGQRAEALLPAEQGVFGVKVASGATLRAKSVVISTGARWREMNVPGEREYRGRGVAYCPHCDGPLFKGKRVAVVGGGNSGVEAAIDLAGIVEHVTLIEFDAKLRADEVLQRKLRSLHNVNVITSALTTEVHGDGDKVNALSYRDRSSEQLHRVELAGVFVQIGLLPNTDWLKGSIELTPRGEIVVDARGQTSVPGVFGAGDVTTVPYKQIVIAMGEGSKAALSAFDYLIRSSAGDAEKSETSKAA
ncbi:MAG TPA: alkyl hydroperoxide reductase subunit F [Steroidobacteraceae bacterium]|nr:alkyl hydroperoxide reductase subunit F [Steroidobacteraceae bacterium]